MHLNTDKFNTLNDIINAFANHFSNVYEKYDYMNVSFKPHKSHKVIFSSLYSCSIDLTEVFESLSSLSTTFSPGPDLIPSMFLKNYKFIISLPLLHLFNLSLSTGIFLITWKTNFIRPIPKSSSDLSNISNYQTISLLSLIPKIFVSIVVIKVLIILNNVILGYQHGFRRNKNTITNLLHFQHFVSDAISLCWN